MIRDLDFDIQQFVSQIVNEPPPYHQSLWLTSDGYFYTLTMVPADVPHKNFKTTTWLLKAGVHMVWLGVDGRNICLPLH